MQVRRGAEGRALCQGEDTLTTRHMAKAGGAAALHTQGWYSLQGCPGQLRQLKRAHSRVLSFGGQLGKRDRAVKILPGQQVGGKSLAWAEMCH